MRARPVSSVGARAAAAVLVLSATGCGHLSGLHWPSRQPPPTAPVPVHELDITGAAGADAVAQYWNRNTLVVDLSGAGGSGSITLKPAADTGWPVRIALRVTPGAIGALEVRAAQRVRLPISATLGKPVDLELTPGVYSPRTPDMQVSWGPESQPEPLPQSAPTR